MSFIGNVIESVFKGLRELFWGCPDVQVLRYKQRQKKKQDKLNRKIQFNEFFADVERPELLLLERLADSDNTPQTCVDEMLDHWEVNIKDVNEKIYQHLPKNKIRINPVIFDIFRKEFEKYGRKRI